MEGGRVTLDRSLPTAEALADPEAFLALLRSAGPPDLVAGPSGYGLPLGGRWRPVVDGMRLRFASGTSLDLLAVISPADARRRLGLA